MAKRLVTKRGAWTRCVGRRSQTGSRAPTTALISAALLAVSPTALAQHADGTFAPQPDGQVYALAVQPDSNILVGGDFTTLGGVSRQSVGRVLPGGGLDWAFDAALRPDPVNGDDVLCLALQPDGRILAGGPFQAVGGVEQRFLARLQPNGARDQTFDIRPADAAVWALAVQADGKFLAAGADPSAPLRRLEQNGWPDRTFNPTANDAILCVAVQADGRILVGGRFTTLNGQPRNHLGRLRADGTLDETFNPNAAGDVQTLAVQPDGKILVGGEFTVIGGQSHTRLARLAPDGTVEDWFNVPLCGGPNGRVETIALLTDGTMVVGGGFSEYGGETREGLAWLLSDGCLDRRFALSGTTIATVHALAPQADGRLLVGGLIFQLSGWPLDNLGRLESDRVATQDLTFTGSSITWMRGGASPEVWRTTFESSTNGANWTPLGAGMRIPGGWQLTGLSLPAAVNVRARGWLTGGRGNGSAWFVETVTGPPLAPPVIVTQPASQSRCPGPGQTATFSVVAGGIAPFTYQWRKDGVNLSDSADYQGTTTDTLQVLQLTTASTGAYDVVVRNGSGSVTSAAALFTIGASPGFPTQPASLTRNPGESATFEVVVTGAQPMTYQWRRDGVPLAGATGATLTVANLRCDERAVFDVIVANPCGSATSAPATLTVRGVPVIVTPPAHATAKPGESTTFGVVADGAPPFSYQWRKDGVPLAGQTGATLTVPNVQRSDRGWFEVVVANACGSATSAGAYLALMEPGWSGPRWLGEWPGFKRGGLNSFTVVGRYAYLAASDAGLVILDVTNAREPVRVGGLETGWARGVCVVGNLAYVGSGPYGLQIIDVSHPERPVAVGGWVGAPADQRSAGGVQVIGHLAYVADGEAGLDVFDVGNPARPVRLGGCLTGGQADAVQVVGTFAYVTGYDAGLRVVDVSDPAHPVPLGSYATGQITRGVHVIGNLAYLANWHFGLEVIDVSNPANPVRVGGYEAFGAAQGVQVFGNLAFVANGGNGVQILDVGNPANPVRVSGILTGSPATGVQPVGGSLLFVGGFDGLETYSLKTLEKPVGWARYQTRGSANEVRVVGGLAYVADGPAGLQILDVNDPANPVRVGGYDTFGPAVDVEVAGNVAYVADDDGLQILDVGNPANALRVGRVEKHLGIDRVAVVGNRAYLASGFDGLEVFDVSDPTNPVRLGAFATYKDINDVTVVGNRAYLASGRDGLQIIDVSNPANPVRLGGLVAGENAVVVQVVGSVAYVAARSTGLQLIDVSDPANPVRLGGYDTPGYTDDVHVVGNRAYLAGSFHGLQIIDVGNPANPARLSEYNTPGYTEDVHVVGNRAYLADGTSGLHILQLFDDRPVIKEQPLSQTRSLGESVTFTVTTVGTPPTSYQWRKDGVPLPGQTGATLTLGGLQRADAGFYDVIVANDYGSTASAKAELKLILTLDESFQPRLRRYVLALAPQSDGRVLLAGYSGFGGGDHRGILARLDREGIEEPVLNSIVEGTPLCLASQPDDGLWLGGGILLPGGSIPTLVRLDRANSVTAALALTRGAWGMEDVRCLAWQADGKLLVGGAFGTLGGKARLSLARLNTDGTVDEGFQAGVDGIVGALAVQPDGRILVGGSFSKLAGENCRGLGRLLPDGRFDASFANAGDGGSVHCLVVQPDGSILVGGMFESWNGVSRLNLCRVNSAGQLDPSFNPVVTGHLGNQWEGVTSLALQADGKIVSAGLFTTVGGLPRANLARLNPDGTADVLFAPNPDSLVDALALDGEGRLLAGGMFFHIAGQLQPIAARLLNPDPAINDLQFTPSTITWRRGGSAPEVWRTTFETSADGVSWTPLGAGTRIAGGWQLAGLSLNGQSRIRARGFAGSGGGSDYFVESYAGAPTLPDAPRLTFPEPGAPLTLTARFEGTGPFRFQWFKTGQPLADGDNLDGATRADLIIQNPTAADAGEYSVEVGNAQGQMLAPVATVAFGPPQILRQPAGLAVRTGESTGFSVAVQGTPPFTYRWRKDGAEMPGATGSSFSIPTTVLQDAGRYDVVVENSYGTVISAPAELTVRLPAFGTPAFTQAALEANENAGTVSVSVARGDGSDGAVSVDYRLAAGGTATEGSDFTLAAGTLSWEDGDASPKSFAVTILDDSAVEADETIRLELTNPTGGASLGTPAQATVTITDNDAPPTRALTLTLSPAGAGTIQANPLPGTDGRYVQGTTVTVTATAAPGAVFLRWEGALSGSDPVGTVTVTEDLAARAVFSRPFGGVARIVPGLIQAEDFDEGGEGVGYHDSDTVNNGVATYRVGGVDIGLLNTPGHAVGWSNHGEWLAYTINVATAGRYRPVLRVASALSGGTAQLDFEDGTAVQIPAPPTGGWQTWVEVTGAPVHLEAGLQVMRFSYAAAGFDLDWIRLEDATLSPLGAASLAGSGEVGVRFQRVLEPASATRAANYEIPGAVVTGATLAPDGSGVLVKTTGLAGSVFTVRVSGVRDTLGNQVADGAEIVGQVLAQRRQDVGTAGDPAVAGKTFSSRAGEFDVLAGGTDMWNNQDGFHFIHQPITGDFDVRVRVESLDPVNRWTKAGLMARESLTADSRNLAVVVEPPAVATRDGQFNGVGADTYALQGRMTRGGATVAWTIDGAVLTGPPYPNAWLRLQRQGSVFRAYRGNDGVHWTLIGETTQSLPTTLHVGLGTSSHNNAPGYTTLARYREYQRAGVVAPRITSEPGDLAVAMGGPATFSVAASGAEPLRYQWQFDGVNLADATGSTLSLGSVGEASAGGYRVIVANEAGLQVSRSAALTVDGASPPPSLRLSGAGATFALVVTGAPGTRFEVLFSTDLVHWSVLTEVVSDGSTIEVPITPPDPERAFFQVRAVR